MRFDMSFPIRRRLAWIAVGLGAVWALGVFILGPALVRHAYAGRSLPVLNGILSGREANPVDFYVAAWYEAAIVTTALAVASAMAIGLAVRFPHRLRMLLSRMVGGTPNLPERTLLRIGLLVGGSAGLLEAGYLAIRQLLTTRPAAGFYPEILWAAPLSAMTGTLLVVALLAGLSKAAGTAAGVRQAMVLLGVIPIFGLLQSEGVPLHRGSAFVLSLGFATVMAGFWAHHVDRLLRLARLTPLVLGFLAVLGIGWATGVPKLFGGGGPGRGASQAAAGLPNILLIILDTVRADNIGLSGYERETTPNIDRWAATYATVFLRAIAPAPVDATQPRLPLHWQARLGVGSWIP